MSEHLWAWDEDVDGIQFMYCRKCPETLYPEAILVIVNEHTKLEEDYAMLQKGLCGTNAELSLAWVKLEKLRDELKVIKLCNSALGGDNERLEAELSKERGLRYKIQNVTSKRIYELETDLYNCRKLAHSYIEAYEKLAFEGSLKTENDLLKERLVDVYMGLLDADRSTAVAMMEFDLDDDKEAQDYVPTPEPLPVPTDE